MFKNYRLRDYDFKLIILILALSIIGIITIGSAEPAQQTKQMAGVVAGLVIMIALSFFNYSVILKLYWLMYIGNLVLLGLVILMGEEGNGAQRWLKIGGLQFQPSELAKILLILFFAQFIMKYKEKLNTFDCGTYGCSLDHGKGTAGAVYQPCADLYFLRDPVCRRHQL